MASKQSVVDFILEQTESAHTTAKKMFGEYGLYSHGKIVGFICDDQLFIKPTHAGRTFIGNATEGFPYPGAKPYLLISGDRWEDSEWLTQLIKLTAEDLPASKK